jgi:hypothetical protein
MVREQYQLVAGAERQRLQKILQKKLRGKAVKKPRRGKSILPENLLRVLSGVYDIFIGFLRLAQDAEFIEACRPVLYRRPLRGHHMSGARPIKMSYTPDQVMCAGGSGSTKSVQRRMS